MKKDISNEEFIKKRTQNIKYLLLKELGYDNEELKIDITPYIFKGSVEEISFQFYLDVMCDADLDDLYKTSYSFTQKVEEFFEKFGFDSEYNFVGNPSYSDYNLMGPMMSYLHYTIVDEGMKMNVEYIYETKRLSLVNR
jgi:hypothetical protein